MFEFFCLSPDSNLYLCSNQYHRPVGAGVDNHLRYHMITNVVYCIISNRFFFFFLYSLIGFARPLYTKTQSRSFPELSQVANHKTFSNEREFNDNKMEKQWNGKIKTSKLPVTSRYSTK